MFFLLRTAFWLTLVLVLIPLGSGKDTEPVEAINPVSAYLAAQATVSDIGNFCDRNRSACETGGNALTAIGSRARDGARIVYKFLDTKVSDKPTQDLLVTGSTAVQPTSDTQSSFESLTSSQAKLNSVSNVETVIGPFPRPKPSSGQKP
ncbi:MAG: DUF5330 domain-containing protein [Roseibium sp.]